MAKQCDQRSSLKLHAASASEPQKSYVEFQYKIFRLAVGRTVEMPMPRKEAKKQSSCWRCS